MPLLRLSRHLRPCHLSRGAQQARCVSQTGIVQQSADGDDALRSAPLVDVPRDSTENTIKIRHVHPKQPKNWWSATKQNFASPGLGTASTNEGHLDKQNNESMKYQELYNDELAQIKNQLQQLSNQFKTLQHTLKEIRSTESDARYPAASDVNSLFSPAFTPTNKQHAISHSQSRSHGPNAFHESTKDSSSERFTGKKSLVQTKGLILNHAMAKYRNSILILIRVSTLLEAVASRFSAKIAIIHARHLHVTIQDYLLIKDHVANNIFFMKELERFERRKTWYAKAVYLPPREKESQAKSESILRLYLLGRAQKVYFASAYILIRIGNELETMRPAIAWTIKNRILKQIRAITQIATREEDERVLTALKDYNGDIEYPKLERELVNSDPQNVTIPTRLTLTEQVDQKIKGNPRGNDKEPKFVPDKGLQNQPKSSHSSKNPSRSAEAFKRSLLQELFPEATGPQARASENYPKLDPPNFKPIIQKHLIDRPKTLREQVVESFQKRGEQMTVLQLSHCSTSLVEADFRRLIPKGEHIEAWRREGDFTKIIPGRDPLSLERLPFYYILFKNPESALAYQKNASRLHKLSSLHQPANIFSAIPPPKGFLEDGEDLQAVTSMYNLLPTQHPLTLYTVMQPYNPVLRSLFDRGGYTPIVPDTDEHGKRIWKVLFHIEGYEPTPSDLFKTFRRDAFVQGLPMLTLRNESSASIHRLRDIMNLKTDRKTLPLSKPLAANSQSPNFQADSAQTIFEDPALTQHILARDDDRSSKELNQLVMNRVYNRWIIDFADEDAAIRFSRRWHRRVLPNVRDEGQAWRETEEERWCNAEVLW